MTRRRAVVLGLGKFGGGRGAAEFLLSEGWEVTVTDLRRATDLSPHADELARLGARLALGEHRAEDFDGAELVVVNPAVPAASPWIARARAGGARCATEIELFLERCPARVFAVTGTQGKSSTCHLTAHLLEASGLRVHLGGNIGGSLLSALGDMRAEDAVVLELSSYQLEHLERTAHLRERGRVRAVAVTNVLADHLERHGDVDAYAAAKRRLLSILAPDGNALLPDTGPPAGWSVARGQERLAMYGAAPAGPGLRIVEGRFERDGRSLGRVADLPLLGDFQRDNALTALGLASCAGADPRRLARALATARGVPHRLERLGEISGCAVYDNGVSTTPDSTTSALLSVPGPSVLLCGGRMKSLPLEGMLEAATGRVQLAVLFGQDADTLASAFESSNIPTQIEPKLEEAIERACANLDGCASLLFSPACASFDAYLNFEERAHAFRRALPPLTP